MIASWKGVQKKLSADLEKVDVAKTGFWWCLRCQQITELAGPEYNQHCAHCGSRRVGWKEPVKGKGAISDQTPLPELPAACRRPRVPDDCQDDTKRRLPIEKRDLRKLAESGYFFCYGCREITEKEGAVCALCGSDKVEWNEPAF